MKFKMYKTPLCLKLKTKALKYYCPIKESILIDHHNNKKTLDSIFKLIISDLTRFSSLQRSSVKFILLNNKYTPF